jgi:Leucine Rich repeat
MHAVKSLVASNCCKSLNLASNMISESGLNCILKELSANTSIETLDIGIWRKSIRKNSIGSMGAKCIAATLIHNRSISTLRMQDNDIGVKGADLISQALKQNKSISHLKISENNIQTEGISPIIKGAEQILKSNFGLISLDLGKNSIGSKIGTTLQYFVSNSSKLHYLNLEHNNLQLKGIEFLTSVRRYNPRACSIARA